MSCVCMYTTRVYTYTYLPVWFYLVLSIFFRTCVHIHMHTCVYVHMHMYIIYVLTYMHTYIAMPTQPYIHSQKYIAIQPYMPPPCAHCCPGLQHQIGTHMHYVATITIVIVMDS